MFEINYNKTKAYITRDGRKAVLTSNDWVRCPESYNFIGYVIPRGVADIPGERIYHFWCDDGSARCCSETPSALDIIGPLEEPKPSIEWSRYPAHFRYVAMDSNGKWHGYFKKPTVRNSVFCDAEVTDYEGFFEIDEDDYPEFGGDWKASLCVRPGVEEEDNDEVDF